MCKQDIHSSLNYKNPNPLSQTIKIYQEELIVSKGWIKTKDLVKEISAKQRQRVIRSTTSIKAIIKPFYPILILFHLSLFSFCSKCSKICTCIHQLCFNNFPSKTIYSKRKLECLLFYIICLFIRTEKIKQKHIYLFISFPLFSYSFTILLPLLDIPSPILLLYAGSTLHHQSLLIVLVSSFVVGALLAFSSSAELL